RFSRDWSSDVCSSDLVCQWAKHLGATVIGTVGSDEKAEQVRQLGADHVIVYSREDFVARTREITDGRGVDVVYDSVGKATFLKRSEERRVGKECRSRG